MAKRNGYTTKSWAEAERFLSDLRGRLAETIVRCGRDEKIAVDLDERITFLEELAKRPIPMHLWCPECGWRHVDQGVFATKVHHTHACQKCGHTWRPAVVATVGVQFLPGFKDEEVEGAAEVVRVIRDMAKAQNLSEIASIAGEMLGSDDATKGNGE